MLTVLGGLAEFERDLIRALTSEGREHAKSAWREDGPSTQTQDQRREARSRFRLERSARC
jgi:DNA invertase Pin-like site-specific DNA recombinase